ncbi:molecular chaperone [Sphingomonas segetis]|jgi:P pilus assembly chaperone PapD|uniref:fimbrial biogenesis chaperone n=1 Tax=Sphingomonas segetis TaxID=1104779 RepID=UPI001E588D72|nr:fimbria/pilus periplasmic chaperone [Sphingomonas segetis]
MFALTRKMAPAVLAAAMIGGAPVPAQAGVGDLLVAPTRIILDGRKGTEIVLNNIGDAPATYRISVEFRHMTADGNLEEVAEPTAAEKAAADMIVYAPRRVTLAPHEPQSIRIAARPPQNLPDGEYRVHLLFRAIPPTRPVTASGDEVGRGLRLQLIPVYGVTIPVIVRLGNLQATAAISNVELEKKNGKPAIALDLSRSGPRSTFGEVLVTKPGVKDPIAIQKAVAVYTELGSRHVEIPVDDAYKGELVGPVTVQYVETFHDGKEKLAETQAVLR